jgi:hypothetical protein
VFERPSSTGNLSGDYTALTSGTCSGKGQVTFNRAGDADVNSLPDPAKLAPRVVPPAQALHGRHLETTTYTELSNHRAEGYPTVSRGPKACDARAVGYTGPDAQP